MSAWEAFPWPHDEPDPLRDRLCDEATGDRPLECRLEGANFAPASPQLDGPLTIWAYNIERGLKLDAQLRAFTTDPGGPAPDVLLLSEADRGCSRTGGRNVTREYAEALGMAYVYGVEFVELPRWWGSGGGRVRAACEHGNAILSHFPIGNVRLIRHERSRSWNNPLLRTARFGQPRLGGRVAVAADIKVGDRLVRVYSVHFESGRGGRGSQNRDAHRVAEANELLADASDIDYPTIIGGDMNVVGYLEALTNPAASEPTANALLAAGYEDAHSSLAPHERITTDTGVVIDLIVARGVRVIDAGVGRPEIWHGLSDHLPIWARISSEDERW